LSFREKRSEDQESRLDTLNTVINLIIDLDPGSKQG